VSQELITMTEAKFFNAMREAQAYAWDAAVMSMVYPDGTKVELMTNDNPYRRERS